MTFNIFGWRITIHVYRLCPWCKDGEAATHAVHGCPISEDEKDKAHE